MAERLKNGGRKEADSVEGRKDVTGWAEAWDRWWFAPELGHRLAAFRILFGVYLLGYFGSFIPKVVTVFSTQGVYSPWCAGDIALPPAGAVALYGLMMGVIAAFIFGCKTRWITPLLLLLYIYYWLLNLAVKDTAYDRLNLLFLFLSCWGELDAVWAVSPSRQRESGRESRVLPWAGRVLMLQLSLLYLGAGLWKVCGSAWGGGDARVDTGGALGDVPGLRLCAVGMVRMVLGSIDGRSGGGGVDFAYSAFLAATPVARGHCWHLISPLNRIVAQRARIPELRCGVRAFLETRGNPTGRV